MKQKYKIAAAVILFNPPSDFHENMRRYEDDVDHIYIIDNSDPASAQTAHQLRSFRRAQYIPNGKNLGIAKALNIAAGLAIKDGYEFLLTMDQDSIATPGMVGSLLSCLEACDRTKIGIISPLHVYTSYQHGSTTAPCEDVLTVMTSGNLLNLKAYRIAGPFLDELFIDYVDHEYCMRLRLHDFRIIQANSVVLHHKLGAISEHRLLFKKFALGNHPPLRRYYMTRNKFYLHAVYGEKFPDFFRSFYKLCLYEILTILFLESTKVSKLRMIIRGYRDYKNGILGKYEG